MRVFCSECGNKALINKTNRISDGYANLYCSCTNVDCGHRFVSTLAFSHSLSPSALNRSDAIKTILALCGKADANELRRLISDIELGMKGKADIQAA